MKMVARKQWGGDRKSLTLLYTALVRSKIDYASFLYSTAKPTYLTKLDRVQYQALRIIGGFMKCTPVIHMEAELNILPLKFRREQLMLNYFTKIIRLENHPVTIAYKSFYNFDFYRYRPWALPVIGRAKELIEKANIPTNNLEIITPTDLFYISVAEVRYNLVTKKRNRPVEELQQKFLDLKDSLYNNYTSIFTDGSRMNGKTSYAFIVGNHVESNRLPSTSSVYTAEMYAIYKAIKYVYLSDIQKAVIFSDSLSVLQAIASFKTKCHYMIKLQKLISICGKDIVFEWVPSHVGIHGNTLADTAAKNAIEKEFYVNTKIHFYDLRPLIKTFAFQHWQSEWSLTNCSLSRLKPVLADWKSTYRDVRREEIVLARLRVGTCLFMYKHHFNTGTPIDFCHSCNVRNTIFHLLLKCPQLTPYRTGILAHLEANRLSHSINNILGDDFPSDLLFKFLKDVNYYHRI